MSLIRLICPICGGKVSFNENENIAECEHCGSELIFKQEVENQQNQHSAEIEMLTDRIFDLIGNKEFVQAKTEANEGLLTFPYSGRLHFCLLLCELKVDNPEKLANYGKDYSNSVNFQNCMRYMTAQDKTYLTDLYHKNKKIITEKKPCNYTTSIVDNYTTPSEERYLRDKAENSSEIMKKRANDIMQSNMSLIDKMKELAYNPYSDRDIIDYMLKNGTQIINTLYSDELVDEQGNSFVDFVESDNNFYFNGLSECLEEIHKPKNTQLLSANKAYVDAINRAVEMWRDLNNICELYIDEEFELDELVERYRDVEKFIQSCADYELSKLVGRNVFEKMHIQKVIERYIDEQTGVLQDYFSEHLPPKMVSALARKLGIDYYD